MKRKNSILIALLLTFTMIMSTPLSSIASEGKETNSEVTEIENDVVGTSVPVDTTVHYGETVTVTVKNPKFEDFREQETFSEESPEEELVGETSGPVTYSKEEFIETYKQEAGKLFTNWDQEFWINYECELDEAPSTEEGNALRNEYMDLAQEYLYTHTGIPTAGDYASRHAYNTRYTGGWTWTYSYEKHKYIMTVTVVTNIIYTLTSGQQEQETEKINEILESLELNTKTEYGKIKAIHDYICEHVTYDNEHLNDSSYKNQFTSYGAVMDGTCVCEGYTLLFYRLALSAGLDARIIDGIGGSGTESNHAWNIVRLKGKYYNIDVTWDDSTESLDYFLKCPANFKDHTREEKYDTAEFHAEYPMADSDYVVVASDFVEITPVSIEKASVAGVSRSYGYSGKAYTPVKTVTVNGVTLVEGTDYTIKYENNEEPGTATITITGIGNYTGTRIKTFEIVDCVSELEDGKTYQLIPKNNSSTAVCSIAGRMVNNTKVYITNRSSSEAMRFKAVKNSDGTWKFINAKCELAFAVQQNSSEVGKGLVLYDQTTKKAQNWKLLRKSDNSFAVTNAVSGLYVAMSDASAVKGTTLSMQKNSGRGEQRYYFVETAAVDAAFDGTYGVKASKDSTFGLNVAASSKEDGANVNLLTYNDTNAMKFNVIYSGGGYYRLVNVNSGLALSVKGNTKTNGANVIQSKWAAQSGQRWKITENSNGTVTLTNVLGTVLHLTSNKTADGTNVMAKVAATTSAQKWYLE